MYDWAGPETVDRDAVAEDALKNDDGTINTDGCEDNLYLPWFLAPAAATATDARVAAIIILLVLFS